MNPALATLEQYLAIARQLRANEVRLVSGQAPQFIVGGQVRRVGQPTLSVAMVRDVHLACLTMAQSEIPASDATFAYRMVSASLGLVSCKYTLRRRARTLSLVVEGQAKEVVEAGAGGNPPALRAEAKVERKRRGDGESAE
jgi:hypothetical protein